jgi:cobalt-zinc-cadmium efflux system protein
MLGSVGAIAAGIVILTTGWTPADPIISAIVALLILASSWRLVRESVDILLEAVPSHIDLGNVRGAIADIPGVEEVHDLHVWTLTSGYLAMSGHAVITDPTHYKEVLRCIHERMHERFGIDHVTVQIEHQTLYPLRPSQRK